MARAALSERQLLQRTAGWWDIVQTLDHRSHSVDVGKSSQTHKISSVAIEWSYTCPRDFAFEDDRPRLAGRWLERANFGSQTRREL